MPSRSPASQRRFGRLDVAAKDSELVLVELCAALEVARAGLVRRRDTPQMIQKQPLFDETKLVGSRNDAQHFAVSSQHAATRRALDGQSLDLSNGTTSEPAGNQRGNACDNDVGHRYRHRGVQARSGTTARSIADRDSDDDKRHRPGVEETCRYSRQQVAAMCPAPDAMELLSSLHHVCGRRGRINDEDPAAGRRHGIQREAECDEHRRGHVLKEPGEGQKATWVGSDPNMLHVQTVGARQGPDTDYPAFLARSRRRSGQHPIDEVVQHRGGRRPAL